MHKFLRGLSIIAMASLVSGPVGRATETKPYEVTPVDAAYDLKLLEEVTNISSETDDVDGVAKVNQRFETEFKALGFQTYYLENTLRNAAGTGPLSAPLLVAEFKGRNAKFISFVGHADTVFKAVDGKVATPYQVTPDGQRILGSGVGDDKGGVIVGLRALRLLLAKGEPKYSLRFIVSPNEEKGSPGITDFFKRFATDSVAVLGLEPARMGNILSGRGGVHWYQVDVKGVEGHAGVAHHQGVNACLDLAIKLTEIAKFTNYAENLTVNIGTILGGKRANIVCGEATAVIDTRFATEEQSNELTAKFTQIFTAPAVRSADGLNTPTTSTIKTLIHGPAFNPSSINRPFLDLFLRTANALEGGQSYVAEYSRGGADISHMVLPHLIMMDGLGPFSNLSHTPDEFITLDSMRTRPAALATLLEAL